MNFEKIIVSFKKASVYIIIFSLFFIFLSCLVYSGGFISIPYVFFYIMPTILAVFVWPITIIVSWLIGLLLIKIQKKILPNNKKVFITIIIGILLLILSYPFTIRHSLLVFKVFPSSTVCQLATPDNGDKKDCYFKLAIKKNEAKFCSQTIYNSAECYLQLAVKNNSLSICDMIFNQFDQHDQTACYAKIAIMNNDLKICDRVSSKSVYNKSDCYTSFAFFKKDTSICYLPYPEDEYIIKSCLATVLGN